MQKVTKYRFVHVAVGLVGILSALRAAGQEDQRMTAVREMAKDTELSSLWWIRPKDPKWKHFAFVEVTGDAKKVMFELFSKAEKDALAGNFLTLDLPFKDLEERGQGILVLTKKDNSMAVGFRFRGIDLNKRCLNFISLERFIPAEGRIGYEFGNMEGMKMGADFRSVLKGAVVQAAKDDASKKE